MSHGIWFFIALLLCTSVTSMREEISSTPAYNKGADYNNDPETIKDLYEKEDYVTINPKTLKEIQKDDNTDISKNIEVERDKEELTTSKQFANYEVTELVIDVPDANTKRVPIFTNFTVARPLNFAGVARNNTDNVDNKATDEGDETINSIFTPDKKSTTKPDTTVKHRSRGFDHNKDKKIYFNNFHPSDDFDLEENDDDEDEFKDFDFKDEFKSKDFKHYFHDIERDIVTGLKNVIDQHKDDINDSLHKIVKAPLLFLTKLYRKKTDFFNSFDNAGSIHDHKNEDSEDDSDDYEYEY